MALAQFQQISMTDLSKGIDQRSAPNAIPEGYAEDLQNVITNSNGFLAKRPGYEGFYGYLPIRITSIQHSGTSIIFTLDSSINIGNVVSSPIVVYGRLSATQSGDFSTTNNGEYYTGFSDGLRSVLTAPSGTTTVLQASHGVAADEVLLQINQSVNTGNRSNSWLMTDRMDINNSAQFDIDITATIPSDIEFYTLIKDKSAGYTHPDQTLQYQSTFVDGDVNTGTDNINDSTHGFFTGDKIRLTTSGTLPAGLALATDYYVIKIDANNYKLATTRANAVAGTPLVDITAAAGGGTHTATLLEGYITIAAGTHGLSNFNIIPHVYYLDGSEYVKLEMPDVTVNSSTGLVNVVITNSSGATMAVRVVLSAAAATDAEFKTILPSTTDTIVISTINPFNFFALYSAVGTTSTLIFPDSVVYDEDTSELTVTITNSSVSTESYKFYWEAATVQSSTLTVTDNGAVSASYTDTAPQLTMWGISHENIYTDDDYFEGHVNHIDTYRTDTQSRVVAALGGTLYTASTRAESNAAYLIPTTNIDLNGQVSTDAVIGPVFVATGGAADRTNGNVVASDVSSNYALITAVSYVSSGVAKYTLSLTGKSGTLSASVNVTSATADYLTVTGMAHSINNGTFKITAVNDSENSITVTNSSLTVGAFDETGAQGRGGIFTDRLTLSANSKMQVGDTIPSNIFDGFTPIVLTSSGTTVVLRAITGSAFITSGTTLFPTRDGSVLPVDATTNFVKGDMCAITDLDRKVRVLSINTSSDVTISSIVPTSGTALVTTATAHNLEAGDTVTFLRTGSASYDTEITVMTVINTTSFTFTTTATDSVATGVILGKTITIDEDIEVNDATSTPMTISVVGRWLPVEAPDSDDDLPATTNFSYFNAQDYDKQEPLRSTMVQDNLYLTDSYNEVLKFDGTSIYQAGIFRWQPQLFAQVDTTTASIPLDGTVATQPTVAAAGNKFTVALGEQAQFTAGDIIIHSGDSATYIVQSTGTNATQGLIYVTKAISDTTTNNGTLKKVSRYKYYFRLNAIDANNNQVASAATGQDDFVIDLSAAGQIHMRLLGMPVWGVYDYDSIELEVYRTARGSSGPFYRVGVKDVEFDHGTGYIDFRDDTTDEFLATFDPVFVSLGLGSELGTGLTHPLRAEYITSLDNRLVLGNIKDYSELDIVLRSSTGVSAVTAANLSGKKFRFKKDTTSASTATDMVNIVNYEFMTSGAVTINPAADIATSGDGSQFTVTEAAHGLVAGNWVYFFHAAAGADNELNFAGWFQIASADTNTFTIDFSGHGRGSAAAGAAADVDRYVAATTKTDIPVWLGTDGNLNTVGGNTINEFSAMVRLASAINASMRMTDTSLASPDMTAFTPWIIAQAGNDIGLGRLVVRQEKAFSATMSVVLPAAITGASVFVKGIRQAASAEVDATTEVFQSRVLISYKNNPEIFDNPYADEANSDSVIDINSADGQEITGIIPFFGDSVFGQGQAETVLVVFKTNSIYLVDITTKAKSKLQSRGLGCTAPGSIASTKDGIMFANESGIYRLNRNQTIDPIGAIIDRIFQDEVTDGQLSLLRGHHYGVGQQYKLSVPVGEGITRNNQVLVYDHQRESLQEGGMGAWTRFTNHPATGWANLASDAFFATSNGQVFKVRNEGDVTDYRDDAEAVDDMIILLRANSFGAPGSRKIVANVISHFQLRNSSMEGTELFMSPDLDGVFTSAGEFDLTKGATNKVESVKSSLPQRRLTYIQLKYINSTKDEDVILTGVDYTAALLNPKGINESGET